MVRKTFNSLDIADFGVLYMTYIRPHLEFCIEAWSHILPKTLLFWKMFKKQQ